jgi:hypothetical protein
VGDERAAVPRDVVKRERSGDASENARLSGKARRIERLVRSDRCGAEPDLAAVR